LNPEIFQTLGYSKTVLIMSYYACMMLRCGNVIYDIRQDAIMLK